MGWIWLRTTIIRYRIFHGQESGRGRTYAVTDLFELRLEAPDRESL
jgi:hypothetical protein